MMNLDMSFGGDELREFVRAVKHPGAVCVPIHSGASSYGSTRTIRSVGGFEARVYMFGEDLETVSNNHLHRNKNIL